MSDKIKLRHKLIKWRASHPSAEQQEKSDRILVRLESLDLFREAMNVLFYYSVNGEVDTRKLIERHIGSKKIYLPKITGRSTFQALPIQSPLNLKVGFEKVPEPSGVEPNSQYDKAVELIILPAVGVDKNGNRLGMGKGYYDRYLQKQKGKIKVALVFEEQVLDSVPKETYDEPVDLIVTDQNIYRCR